MNSYLNKTIKVNIHLTDSEFEDVSFSSEMILVSDSLEDYLKIEYWNDENTDIFVSTGIKHMIRASYEFIEDSSAESNENASTDTNSYLIESEIIEGNIFYFKPLTLELMRKLRIALSHENVFINDVGYVKNGDFEVTPLKGTNLYRLNASMLKTDAVYTTNSINTDFISNDVVETIALVDSGNDEFVSQ